ncbi:MAG TPA: hypothetical protein VFH87_07725 [Candidatus Udaeobacter sp.]|nr:hypothetical protein [Candidatus Udaeobacter sp.]
MRSLLTILVIIAVWFTYTNWRISENFAASMHECRRIIQEGKAGFVHEMDSRAIAESKTAHRVAEQMQQQALNRQWSDQVKLAPMNNWPR